MVKNKKIEDIEQQKLIDVLKGGITYDMGNAIEAQKQFCNRINQDLMQQMGQQEKETRAYYHQQQNKLNLMLDFINSAVSESTGEFFQTKYTSSSLEKFNVKLLITPKEEQ